MKTPTHILKKFKQAAIGLEYGSACIDLAIKGKEFDFTILREESIICKDLENETPPIHILSKLEQAASGIKYGSASLRLAIQEGELRYVILHKEMFSYKSEELFNCSHTDGTEQPLNSKIKRKRAIVSTKPKTTTN